MNDILLAMKTLGAKSIEGTLGSKTFKLFWNGNLYINGAWVQDGHKAAHFNGEHRMTVKNVEFKA